MIISHKREFIFIKTRRTASTSMELYLSQFCGKDDIVTPNVLDGSELRPANYRGLFLPTELPEAMRVQLGGKSEIVKPRKLVGNVTSTFYDLVMKRKFSGHIPGYRLKHRISKEVWDNYFKFCFERNPWDKSVSHYYGRKNKYPGLSFEQYLNDGVLCYNYPIYMDSKQGNVVVDFIGYFESIEEDFREACEIIGIPFNGLPKANVSSKRETQEEFFAGDYGRFVDVIAELYAKEIGLHGYEFDGVVA